MAKHKKRRLDQPAGRRSHGTSNRETKKPPTRKEVHPKKPEQFIPFDPEDRILLIGEGDFSFAKSIVEHHGCYDVTATCLDSKDELFGKYKPQSEQHVRYLEDELGQQNVLYGVDATRLDSNKTLKKNGMPFDKIIFNFPHIGGKTKDVNRQVRSNQELLVNFFPAAMQLLAPPHGSIIVTLFEGEPYTLWNIRDLARHSGLEVQRSFAFFADAYPGYSHSRTLGNLEGGGGWKGESRDSRSYVFRKKGVQKSLEVGGGGRKRRRGRQEESSDDGG